MSDSASSRSVRSRSVRLSAMDMLARREHSSGELRRKLVARDYDVAEIEQTLAELRAENLLSDRRFAEAFIHARVGRGYGPARIEAELRQREVDEALIDACLADCGEDWLAHAARVRARKFGRAMPEDYAQRARQARFLQYRGFFSDTIRRLLRNDEYD
ncbi:MAG TPA: regulatory protein RecX [Gammaproteobacteria bacterium]|nr:regulatory protein RecX [Gammaproteobacteria bacterium]